MIEMQSGDILQADAESLVNTVNCVGVMGRGIALQFRKAYPENYREYKKACDAKQLRPGTMLVHDRNSLHNPRYIINFPTKRHWRGKSRLEDISAGLAALVEEVRARGIRSVAVPPLGCGLGGLDWNVVRSLIEEAFRVSPEVRVYLFEPGSAPVPKAMVKAQKKPNMTIGRAALIGLMRSYLAAVMDPSVTLLEIHKLMYFMQEAGQGLNLGFEKGRYGPYASKLRHVLNIIEGFFTVGFGDAADQPEKPIELLPGAVESASAVLGEHPETQKRFDRVADLIAGFESPFGMELLATVHWVVTREDAGTEQEVLAKTYAWSPHKRMFDQEHIRIAWRVLESKGWLGRAVAV